MRHNAAILAERQLRIVRKRTPVFGTVHAEYLAQRDGRVRRSTRQADDYLFKHFERLSKKKIGDVSADEIDDIMGGIGAPTTKRHAFLRLKGLYRFAIKRDYVERSPLERLDCPEDHEPRERVLKDAELRHVIDTARAYGYQRSTYLEQMKGGCALVGGEAPSPPISHRKRRLCRLRHGEAP